MQLLLHALGVCIIDDDRLIDDITDLEGAFHAWQVCMVIHEYPDNVNEVFS